MTEDTQGPLTDILRRLDDEADDGLSPNDLMSSFEDRSTGVLITLFALLAAIPLIGGIPGVSIASGGLILVAQAVTLLGRGRLRLPAWLGGEVELPQGKVRSGIERVEGLAGWIDRHVSERLEWLTDTTAARLVIHACVALLAVSMFPLALVPWGVTPPALAIMAFGLALVARDGVLALLGYALMIATVALSVWAV